MGSARFETGSGPTGALTRLSAGVVAHNDVASVGPAVRSLLAQDLPPGVEWESLWIVASGCTDGTDAVASRLADDDPRVRVVVDSQRRGKAGALRDVFRRATGDALVLLNADARAEPGSVAALLGAATGKSTPFAVMARPVLSEPAVGRWSRTISWMWDLHHEFHTDLLAEGLGRHLSDELLMLSLPELPPIPEGTINDGSYYAVWLSQHDGRAWYAADARVSIQTPSRIEDHLAQRRRIHVGNAQVTSVLGTPPATLARSFLDRPRETLEIVRGMTRRPGGWGCLAEVAAWEAVSRALALWDQVPPAHDHRLWKRIQPAPTDHGRRAADGGTVATLDRAITTRVRALLRVAEEFGTGVDLAELDQLMPPGASPSADELAHWLDARPALGRREGGRAFATAMVSPPDRSRGARSAVYLRRADALWSGPLAFAHDLVRFVGVSGSAAFGEPQRGDDLDLFVVTRSGALWWFLLRAYWALFRARRREPGLGDPVPCLNLVVEDRAARREFERRGDLLFAREALTVRPVWGDAYYRGLLATAGWMRDEMPRRYDERAAASGETEPSPAPRGIRLLNLLSFPVLATYLQLAGLVRNSRFRRHDLVDREFRTSTARQRLAFSSRRFERLREVYSVGAPEGSTPGSIRSSDRPVAHHRGPSSESVALAR